MSSSIEPESPTGLDNPATLLQFPDSDDELQVNFDEDTIGETVQDDINELARNPKCEWFEYYVFFCWYSSWPVAKLIDQSPEGLKKAKDKADFLLDFVIGYWVYRVFQKRKFGDIQNQWHQKISRGLSLYLRTAVNAS